MATLTSAGSAGMLAADVAATVVAEPAVPVPAVVVAGATVVDELAASLPHAASNRAVTRAPSPAAPVTRRRRRFHAGAGVRSGMGSPAGGGGGRSAGRSAEGTAGPTSGAQ